ncbi:hypothetical protein DL93DRAFT_2077185 [Clavulina sp. PMI_390]|nr:hypothetical protein DL93DRAFT_2077185 [Clavulina sp. PMI_390]
MGDDRRGPEGRALSNIYLEVCVHQLHDASIYSHFYQQIPDGYLDSDQLGALSEPTTSFSIRPPRNKVDLM